MEDIERHLENQYTLLGMLEQWLMRLGMHENIAQFLKIVIAIAAMIFLALLADFLFRQVFVRTITRVTNKTNSRLGELLLQRKFFNRLAHFAPAIIIYLSINIVLIDIYPVIVALVQGLCKIYMIVIALLLIGAFLDTINDLYQNLPFSKSRPIKGYLQVVKIIVYLIGGIIIVSILLKKDPSTLIVGLGASTAILMLVFKDSISGLVASIQLTANDMLKIGDWIEMPSRNIDGNVIDINLTTVKIQNFDNTISTVPPIALVSESYINWRGMEESTGRRIKRSVVIDLKTVKFCTPEMFERFKKIGLISDYVAQLESGSPVKGSVVTVADNATNLNVFRHYIIEYLKLHPKINHEASLIVRLRQPDEYGVPVEIYCFSSIKEWAKYEEIVSDIFDHIVAAIDYFDLKMYQRLSGTDFRDTMLKK